MEQKTTYLESTFQFDNILPSLPVPCLNNTLDYYLNSIKPLVCNKEYEETEIIVNDFKNGVGKLLHKYLLEKATLEKNWLEKWWENVAYLETRTPHSPFVNFGGHSPYAFDIWPPKQGSQLERAALVTWGTLTFWNLLRKEQVPIEKSNNLEYLSMFQLRRIFSCCKIPGPKCDVIKESFKTNSEGITPTYFLVICLGQYFKVESVNKMGDVLTARQIKSQLEIVKSEAVKLGRVEGIGSLTAQHRTTWCQLRNHLLSLSPTNQDNLNIIEDCIFVLSLDEANPSNINECSRESLLGNCNNRWLDKSLNLIVFENGYTGQNCDHAPLDGMAMVTLSLFTLNLLQKNDFTFSDNSHVGELPTPCQLTFVLDATVTEAVTEAAILYRDSCASIELKVERYSRCGYKFFRLHKLSPDASIQMCIQLAYMRMYGRPAPTYETASTRRFYHGRTETIRSCTVESVAFTTSMLSQDIDNKQKYEKFKTCHDVHLKNTIRCSKNEGCDRHLLGLYLMSVQKDIPIHPIFTDSSYSKSGGGGNYILSTSFLGYNPTSGGVAPMCPQGYGCFYHIMPDKIGFFLSCWQKDRDTDLHKFYISLAQSLDDLYHLIDEMAPRLSKM